MSRTPTRAVVSGLLAALLCSGEAHPYGQSAQPTPTISVNVKRVPIDVVVRDSSGKPVSGLTKDDFRVMEDGKSQVIRTFDAYGGAGNGQDKEPVKPPQLPPNTVSNFSSATQTGPLTVVLYDLLNTPLTAQSYARTQLLNFLDKRPKTSPVAIFVLTDALHLLQGFTDDDKALKSALTRQSNYRATVLLSASEASTPSVSSLHASGAPEDLALSKSQTADSGQQALTAANQLSVEQIDSEAETDELLLHVDTLQNSAFLDRRVDITTGALRDIAQFLSALPGRKNLIWLSGSFPAGVLPNSDPFAKQVGGAAQLNTATVDRTAYSDFEVVRNYSDLTRQAANALNESHTAVYPVDARGLQTSASSAVEVAPTLLQKGQFAGQVASAGQVRAASAAFNKQSAEKVSMDSIADDTGGRAAYNTNGLADAALSAIDDGSTYYTLSYQPTNTKADGKLRNIKVECVKHGYTLAYRRNYFGDSSATKSASQPDGADPMLVALRRGSPPAHALFFEAHLQNLGEPAPATPRELQELSQFQSKDLPAKHAGSPADAKPVMMRHYAITYGLVARQLNLTQGADNQRHAILEFAAMAYDRDGILLKGTLTKIDDPIAQDRYDRLGETGYQHVQRIGVPATAVTLRIGVRDATTRLIGSAEIHLPLANEAPAK